jgi:hypothetical protein
LGTADEGSETLTTPVTIKDFKTLESSMATQLGEMRDTIVQVVQASKATTTYFKGPTSLNRENMGDKK